MKSLFFPFLIYLFQFVYTPTCCCLEPHSVSTFARPTVRLIVFKKLSKFAGTLNTKKRVSYMCLYVYRHV